MNHGKHNGAETINDQQMIKMSTNPFINDDDDHDNPNNSLFINRISKDPDKSNMSLNDFGFNVHSQPYIRNVYNSNLEENDLNDYSYSTSQTNVIKRFSWYDDHDQSPRENPDKQKDAMKSKNEKINYNNNQNSNNVLQNEKNENLDIDFSSVGILNDNSDFNDFPQFEYDYSNNWTDEQNQFQFYYSNVTDESNETYYSSDSKINNMNDEKLKKGHPLKRSSKRRVLLSNDQKDFKFMFYQIFTSKKKFPKKIVCKIHEYMRKFLNFPKMKREHERRIDLYFQEYAVCSEKIIIFLKNHKPNLLQEVPGLLDLK